MLIARLRNRFWLPSIDMIYDPICTFGCRPALSALKKSSMKSKRRDPSFLFASWGRRR